MSVKWAPFRGSPNSTENKTRRSCEGTPPLPVEARDPVVGVSGQTSERWPACIPAIRAEVQPPEYGENGITPEFGLSAPDVAEVRKFYPPLDEAQYRKLHPFRFAPFDIGPGEQVNYLIEPTQTREYTMQAFGSADTLMVLFEDHGGDLRFMAGAMSSASVSISAGRVQRRD
jgi:hypothetical protein